MQCDISQSISSFDLVTSRVDPVKKQVTLIQDLQEKLLSLSTETNALKSFVLEQTSFYNTENYTRHTKTS